MEQTSAYRSERSGTSTARAISNVSGGTGKKEDSANAMENKAHVAPGRFAKFSTQDLSWRSHLKRGFKRRELPFFNVSPYAVPQKPKQRTCCHQERIDLPATIQTRRVVLGRLQGFLQNGLRSGSLRLSLPPPSARPHPTRRPPVLTPDKSSYRHRRAYAPER